jgi:hypothetical protein
MRRPGRVVDLGAAGFDQGRKRIRARLHAERGPVVGVVLGLFEARGAREFRIDRAVELRHLEIELRPLGHAVADAARGPVRLLYLFLRFFGHEATIWDAAAEEKRR